MPEKIAYNKGQDNAMSFAIEAITPAVPDLDKFIQLCPEPHLEIGFTVNGVEVPFVKTVNLFVQLLESSINIRAKEMVNEKFQDFINTIEKLRNETEWKIEDAFRDH